MDVNTVVVGYDGSEFSDRAIDAALAVLNEGGTVHLVSAYDAPSAREINAVYAAVPKEFTMNIDLLSGDRDKLRMAVSSVEGKGVAVVDHFVDDDPASAILHVADDVDADMIVVGSRGLGRASRVLRGSVSTKIASHAPIDFMVIH